MTRFFLILPFLIGLSACSSTSSIEVSTKPIDIEVAKTADPEAVQMLPVKFRVVTKDTLDSFISELAKTQNGVPVFIAITVKDYENLTLNFADLRRYIEQQQSVIVYYRNMTTPKAN